MTDEAIICAVYADFKLIKTRGCVQIIFELPLAESRHALEVVGGMPDFAVERRFAIARLQNDAGKVSRPRAEAAGLKAPATGQPSTDKRMARQAALCCKDPVFWAFLREMQGQKQVFSEEAATNCVREFCTVTSRADIKPDTEAGEYWNDLRSRFLAWKLVES